MIAFDPGEVRQFAVTGADDIAILDAERLQVFRPVAGKAFPDQRIDRPRTDQRPERDLEGAGIGTRHDAELPVARQAEQSVRTVDGVLEAFFGQSGAVTAAEKFGVEMA